MSGPFSKYAIDYNDYGLAIIPCGGDDGKKAVVGWKEYQDEHPPMSVFDSWIANHAEKNIGLITGHLNRITVVDCDDPNRSIESLEAEYGVTSLAVETARGGKHLYYLHNGETSRNNFRDKIDIKANGGYVIGPHSINPTNGKPYSFLKGSFEEIGRLPVSTHPSLPKQDVTENVPVYNKTLKDKVVTEGQRNEHLFKITKDFAISVNTFEEILEYAQHKNEELLAPPLLDAEVVRVAKSVWKYKEKDRLWASGEHHIIIPADKFKILRTNPKALALYTLLLLHHKNNKKTFTIIQTGVAKLLFCDPRTVGQSINFLMQNGIIKRVHESRGKSDGHQYCFC